MKQVIQLDKDGYFVGFTTADESPLEPGVFLIPGGAIDAAPPTIPAGKRARWAGASWVFEDLPEPEPEPEPEPLTPEQIMARLKARVQLWLDEQARALGYDDIKSAITYAEEPAVPKFQQEGQALRRLRSLAWARYYEIMDPVKAGQRPIPTEEELIAEMEALK